MAANARKHIEDNFSLKKFVGGMSDLYKELSRDQMRTVLNG
jgi:hypothetical protein